MQMFNELDEYTRSAAAVANTTTTTTTILPSTYHGAPNVTVESNLEKVLISLGIGGNSTDVFDSSTGMQNYRSCLHRKNLHDRF